ncbi:MAG: phosphoribosyltransferase [Methanosarcinales archaeon]|nr:phosphoribosyltransferase [ANME-2 cluster archaeon]MDW7777014.1 phosphoribosyltransferase [Methanosarcinales archaeon]
MREIFFDENNVENSLQQAYKKIKKEGFDSYILLGINTGGMHVAERINNIGTFEKIISCSINNGSVSIPDSNLSDIRDKNILICEDTVISGKTILKVVNKLLSLGAAEIKILSLLMRQNSMIVPNIFVFETEEDTRVYFPWSDYPIRTYPRGIVRKILYEDCSKSFKCGDSRIDKISLSDFFKNQQHTDAKIYLVEDKADICSIIQFYEKGINSHTGLFLDIIATSNTKKGNKYASTLLKLICMYMFHHEFDFIYAYAFDRPGLINMYKQIGFELIGKVEDDNYGILHKMILVNGIRNDKDLIINAVRRHI